MLNLKFESERYFRNVLNNVKQSLYMMKTNHSYR